MHELSECLIFIVVKIHVVLLVRPCLIPLILIVPPVDHILNKAKVQQLLVCCVSLELKSELLLCRICEVCAKILGTQGLFLVDLDGTWGWLFL